MAARKSGCSCNCGCPWCGKGKGKGRLAQACHRRSLAAERLCRTSPSTATKMSPNYVVAGSAGPAGERELPVELVRLNVGGTRATTTRATLLAPHEPRSFFHGLLSTPLDDTNTAEREIFIDRDGRHLPAILNWLRDPQHFVVPSNADERVTLWLEADFYGLDGLCARLEASDELAWGESAFHLRLLDDTRYPQPPRRFDVTMPASATFGQLRFVICALIGYQPQQFDLLVDYTRKVPRSADHQLMATWHFRPGQTTLLRARGFHPKNVSFVRPRILAGPPSALRPEHDRSEPELDAE